MAKAGKVGFHFNGTLGWMPDKIFHFTQQEEVEKEIVKLIIAGLKEANCQELTAKR